MSYWLTGDWNQPHEQPTNRWIPTTWQSPDKNPPAELLWLAVLGILSCTDIRKIVHCDSTGRGPERFCVYCFPTFHPVSIFRLIFMFLSKEAQPWVLQLPARSVGLRVNYWNKGQLGEPYKQQLLSQVRGWPCAQCSPSTGTGWFLQWKVRFQPVPLVPAAQPTSSIPHPRPDLKGELSRPLRLGSCLEMKCSV